MGSSEHFGGPSESTVIHHGALVRGRCAYFEVIGLVNPEVVGV